MSGYALRHGRATAIEDLPPIFTHAEARARGVSDRSLYRWRDRGRVEQSAAGSLSSRIFRRSRLSRSRFGPPTRRCPDDSIGPTT